MSDAPIEAEAWDALQRHVIAPITSRCIDQAYGGFLADFDERWRAAGPQDKSLEHVARTTMAFAKIDRAMPGQGFEQHVRQGCKFLQQAMWDDRYGGFFARVDRSGKPLWEGLKHPHAVTYVAQAFIMAGPHLSPGEGPMWADRALTWLEEVARDPADGGYWGSYRRDNQRYGDGERLPTPDGRDIFGLAPGFKEINTQGDAIELLTELVERGGEERWAARLTAMVELVANQLVQPSGVLPYRYLSDWRPVPDLARVGYQFMMARHFLAAAAVTPLATALARARDLVDFCLASARHPAGGYCFAVTADGRAWPATGASSDLRQWWVQIEAVHTFHLLANHVAVELAARDRYRQARDEQWAFVRNVLFDKRHGGIHEYPPNPPLRWPRRLERRLRRMSPPIGPAKTHCWKDISHEVGTFLELAKNRHGCDLNSRRQIEAPGQWVESPDRPRSLK